ncbi:hypothetical protein EYR40_011063 [Pleurotus pulmonarius]|nr:hypothetical protein EYR36_002832 [Pleurotus pulmonarius]KAF4587042.1 hypothetical protein EYR40_011063 [Pleurotus pulmonarius]
MSLANRARLLDAAQRIAAVLNENNKNYILMGGGASILQGNKRKTKDLDINVLEMNDRLIADMTAAGISIRPNKKTPQRWSATVPETTSGAKDATSVDIALKPEISDLFEHTDIVDGVTVADLHLLLVDKIRTASRRGGGQDQKIINDMSDIFFCLCEMEGRKAAVVPDKLKISLTPEVWAEFWKRAEETQGSLGDIGTYREWLRKYAGLEW